MIAYKGLTNNLTTYFGFQYEVGVTYTMSPDDVKMCFSGFHACQDPMDCFLFYNLPTDVYYKVECNPVETGDTKISCDSIRLLEELTISDLARISYSLFPDKWVDTFRKIETPSKQNYIDFNGNLAYNDSISNWPYRMQEPINNFVVFEDIKGNTHLWDITNQSEVLFEKEVKHIEKFDDRYIILQYDDCQQIYDTVDNRILYGDDNYFQSIVYNDINSSFVLCDGNKYFIVERTNPANIITDYLEFCDYNKDSRFVIIKKNGVYNVFDLYNNEIVYDEWFDDVSNNLSHKYFVDVDDTFNILPFNGKGEKTREINIESEKGVYESPLYSKNLNHEIRFTEYY